ncbi:DsbA family oxidoreductase [Burkholderia sp. Ac-20353]|uniref:DsbA family oxidoreductase n=1 Tax=Burkholderia sp. Ac-20353 TaxID=2703894 RepID=UPI00197BDE82|nr:DsbA family oxidoreductase [Burkholderia sp. Ac-20353]MBN3786451.1 DsbA family oxidoreductase [Burkholderia sp. Ac-20353]
MKRLSVKITYDFICPWCWIGHRNLALALTDVAEATEPEISYLPYELNPSMPSTGVDRKEYRTRKFGSWNRSLQMDAQVAAAGKAIGIDFNYDKVAITPNTFRAHRLMDFAQGKGDPKRTDDLFEAIFAAYFTRGENIGEVDVLVNVAHEVGFDADEVREFLLSRRGEDDVLAKEVDAQSAGVRGVPLFTIGGATIHGAQPARVLKEVMSAEIQTVTSDDEELGEADGCSGGTCKFGG